MIDWVNFSPWTALAGGVILGVSASIFLLFNAQISGISGMLGGLFKKENEVNSHKRDQLLFLVGLLSAGWIWQMFVPLPPITITSNMLLLVSAGLLVGVGTRLASGCTSGHGICGISRLSLRSIAATVIFMLAGFVSVFVVRHLIQ